MALKLITICFFCLGLLACDNTNQQRIANGISDYKSAYQNTVNAKTETIPQPNSCLPKLNPLYSDELHRVEIWMPKKCENTLGQQMEIFSYDNERDVYVSHIKKNPDTVYGVETLPVLINQNNLESDKNVGDVTNAKIGTSKVH